MKDAIGQEINPGDTVAYSGGEYAAPEILVVRKLTAKRLAVFRKRYRVVHIEPGHVVVVKRKGMVYVPEQVLNDVCRYVTNRHSPFTTGSDVLEALVESTTDSP